MKLGAVYGTQVNAFYRVFVPMQALQERGHEVVGVQHEAGTEPAIGELADCELVHIHRPLLSEDGDDFVARLQEAGVLVGFDDDDDSEAAPAELEGIVAEGSLAGARRDFARLLARAPEADLLTTPSADLADRLEQAGAPNVHAIENYLPGAFAQVQPAGHEGLVIGWHAANEHRLDVEALGLGETLVRVLDANPDVHVVTLGIDLGIDHERYRHDEFVVVHELTARLADFDVGIVPLADTAFNRARSNVKAREYAAAGVPWLASPVGEYERLGKDEGGQLVEDDEWPAALEQLIGSARERARLARRGRRWAQRETIARMAHLWEDAFLETIVEAQAAA